MAQLDYDGEQYEEERQIVPAGRYPAVVYKTEFVDLKNYAGKGCRVTFQITGHSQYTGSYITSLYSIYHTDLDKQVMARQMFARLCRCVIGRPNPRDTDELLNRALEIEVVVNDEYNNVKRIFPVESSVPTAVPTASATPRIPESLTPPAVSAPAASSAGIPEGCPF